MSATAISISEIVEAAKTAGLDYTIVCGELHVCGKAPAIIAFRADVIEKGARYLGSFGGNTATPANTWDRTARFSYPQN